jgi:hypothetical protein
MLSYTPLPHSASTLGLVTGLLHHFLIQYPRQAAIFSTIYAYVTGNVVFVAVTGLQQSNATTLLDTFLDITLFNLVYVFLIISSCSLQDFNRASIKSGVQCRIPTSWNSHQVLVGRN